MKELNLTKPLSVKTISNILVYLEKRPLGEVYALFQEIVSQLEFKEADGQPNFRPDANTAGSGNTGLSGDRVPPVEIDEGSRGIKDRDQDVYRSPQSLPAEIKPDEFNPL